MSDIEQLNKRLKEKAVKLYEQRQSEALALINQTASKLFYGYIGHSTHTRDAFEKECKEKKADAITIIEKELSDQLVEKMQQLKYFFEGN